MQRKPSPILAALPLLALTACLAADSESSIDVPTGDDAPQARKGEVDADPIDPDALVLHDDELPTLTALTSEEVTLLRQHAAEQEAEGIDEFDTAGLAALHYALIEVRDPNDVTRLGALDVYWDIMPLFDEERAMFKQGTTAYVDAPSDDVGSYVFAVLPAALYNALLEAERDGQALFPSMMLREVPDLHARDDASTSLSYAWLQEQGFVWDVETNDQRELEGKGPVAVDRASHAERTATVQAYAASALADVHKQLGAPVPAVLIKSADIVVQLTLRSTDPLFTNASTGLARVIRRGWGAIRGRQADVRGANIIAQQGVNRIRRALDASNRATVPVRKNATTSWCLDLRSEGAKITTNFRTANNLCHFSSALDNTVYTADATQTIDIRNTRAAVLTYATDAWQWLREIADHDSLPVAVLVGTIADTVNDQGRAYAVCGSYYGQLGVGNLGSLGALAEATFGHVDLVLPTAGSRQRGVTAHEFGHFALCSLMGEIAPLRFETVWTDVILETLIPQINGGTRGIEHEASWLNEGFADFFASQVVGATNYFTPPDGAVDSGGMAYCRASSSNCLEGNQRFPDFHDLYLPNDETQHNAAVEAFAGLLSDVVDGHAYPFLNQARDVPGNGGMWSVLNTAPPTLLSEFPEVSPRQNDEVVHVQGDILIGLIEAWKDRTDLTSGLSLGLNRDDLLPALADAMRDAGANDSQICRVFALHTASNSPGQSACLDLLPDSNLGVDPSAIALENGDLLTPTSLHCSTPGPVGNNDVLCRWEDFSIDADSYDFRLLVPSTGQVIDEGTLVYQINREHSFQLPPFVGPLKIEMRTRKDDRISDATQTTIFIEPASCGDGIVQAGEVCDGTVSNAACDTSPDCPACKCVNCLSVIPECTN